MTYTLCFQVINGGPLPPNVIADPQQNSFDSSGHFIGSDLDTLAPSGRQQLQLVQERDVIGQRGSPVLRRSSPAPPPPAPRRASPTPHESRRTERSHSPAPQLLFARRFGDHTRTSDAVRVTQADVRSHSPTPATQRKYSAGANQTALTAVSDVSTHR